MRTRRLHPSPLAGPGLRQPAGPAAAQGGQRVHVPQPGAPVSGDQGGAHEDGAGLYLHWTGQRVGKLCCNRMDRRYLKCDTIIYNNIQFTRKIKKTHSKHKN